MERNGAGDRHRTCNPRLTRAPLCQLSYTGIAGCSISRHRFDFLKLREMRIAQITTLQLSYQYGFDRSTCLVPRPIRPALQSPELRKGSQAQSQPIRRHNLPVLGRLDILDPQALAADLHDEIVSSEA